MQQLTDAEADSPVQNLGTNDRCWSMDDLSSIVTIVVVTSPTASNPSTEMIDRCLAGIIHSFPPLNRCQIVIACDGVQVVDSISKHKVKTTRIFGKCTRDSFDRYVDYCQTLTSRNWLQTDCQADWRGFALCLQSALKKVKTPLVMVLPHDYELTPNTLSCINISELLHALLVSNEINYVGLPNPRSSKIRLRHSQALCGIPNLSIHLGQVGVMQLEPIAMWKENPHFAKMEAYESIVFSRHYKRGQFIEDTLGQDMLTNIKERGLGAFHHTYLLALDKPCSFHMDGPRYLPISERLQRHYTVQTFEIEAAERAHSFVREKAMQAVGL